MSKVLDWNEANAALQRAAKAGIGDSPINNSGRLDLDHLDHRYIVALGDRDGKIVNALRRNYLDLRTAWQVYSELYEDSSGSVDTLNWASDRTFGVVQRELGQMLVVRISTFFEGKESNLSFNSISDENIADGTRKLIEDARAIVKPIKTLRHNTVAHNSLSMTVKPAKFRAKPIIGDDVKRAIDAIGKVLTAIHGACFPYELAWPRQNGLTSDLLSALRAAHEQEQKVKCEIGLRK